MKCFLISLLLLVPLVGNAADFSKLQLDKSSISFVSKQMGVSAEGVFKKIAAEVHFNPEKPEASLAKIDIELASIETGSAESDDEVKGKSWFDVAQFPKASFVSGSVRS